MVSLEQTAGFQHPPSWVAWEKGTGPLAGKSRQESGTLPRAGGYSRSYSHGSFDVTRCSNLESRRPVL